MKKNLATYFIAAFFVCIYLLKGSASLMPSLFALEKNDTLFALLMDTETEDQQGKTGEKLDAETKELYFHSSLINLNLPGILTSKAKTSALAMPYIQQVCAAIPTPPPELA